MSRRIDIELTCELEDGSWTWRQSGARAPKGTIGPDLVPSGAAVGTVIRAEIESEIGGGSVVTSVVVPRDRARRVEMIELAPVGSFEPVTQDRARRDRPRNDRPKSDRPKSDRPKKSAAPRGRTRDFSPPPPELPRRPMPKRLRADNVHRRALLDGLSSLERTVAETAVKGGMKAVREAVARQNEQLKVDGKPEVNADNLVALVQDLSPKLRVAEWLDRAEAAIRDLEELDLRDLRSVVVQSDDPVVVREGQTRQLAAQLRDALRRRERESHDAWLGDITAAIGVGRLIRALKLSSEPPKAGQPFPRDLGERLAALATADLNAENTPDRWIAILESVAFSPVKSAVRVTSVPGQVTEELAKTVARLAPAIPTVAAAFGVVPAPGAAQPRPLRIPRQDRKKGGQRDARDGRARGPRRPESTAPTTEASGTPTSD